ncbi:MAG: hypothetical protein IEMM0008_0983 [bacterium]|nr:MAG: hypothetical protein IEMM0008_0983 [bacterium]
MKTRIIRIGNSQGICIPKTILDETGLTCEVELEVKNDHLIIRSSRPSRAGWDKVFKKTAKKKADQLLDGELLEHQNNWDDKNWEW